MVALLPFWPSVYNKLATDCDGRVREQAHVALHAVVRSVGRELATCLRSVCSVWWLARWDPHAPAAAAASAAWSTAFPPHKQAGALGFCQADIMSQVAEHLVLATPATLSDPATTSPEEMEAKYCRTIVMAFSALSSILHLPATLQSLQSLLEQPKLWKYSKHKHGAVRQAFYEWVSCLCGAQPALARDCARQLGPAVLLSLGDTAEVAASSAVWAAALQLLAAVPGVWDQVSAAKAVLPPVYKLMAGAGPGVARHIFPSLMPLLSQVPAPVLTAEDNKAVHRWLGSLNTGLGAVLETSKPRQDSSLATDLNVVVEAYVECIMLTLNMAELDQEAKIKVMEEHLLDNLVLKSLTERKLAESNLNTTLGKFIKGWDSKASLEKLNTLFWGRLTHHCVCLVEEDADLGPGTRLLADLLGCEAAEAQQLSSVRGAICAVWARLLAKLGAGDQSCAATARARLHNVANLVQKCDLKSDSKLRGRLFPDSESIEKFLVTSVLPLLETEELVSETIEVMVTVVSLMESEAASSDILVRASLSKHSELVITNLVQRLSSSKDSNASKIFRIWLSNPNIKKSIVDYIQKHGMQLRMGKSDMKNSFVASLLKSNMEFTGTESEDILTSFKISLSEETIIPSSYLQFVSQVCCHVHNPEDDIWTSGVGSEIAVQLFSLDSDLGEEVWVRASRHSDTGSGLWTGLRQTVATALSGELQPTQLRSLMNKCRKLLENRSLEDVVTFLGPTKVNHQAALLEDILDQAAWSSACDSDQVREDVTVAAAQVSRVLLQVLADNHFPNLDSSAQNITVPDCDRVDVSVDVIRILVEIIVSFCYLEKVTESGRVQAEELRADTELWLGLVVARLSRPATDQLRGQLLEASLRHGGLYTRGLVWVARTVFSSSEWDPRLASLLPHPYTWADTEVTHVCSLLHLETELGLGSDLVTSTMELVTASLVSLGADSWDLTSDSLLWLLGHCLALTPASLLEAATDQLTSVLILVQAATADTQQQLLYNRSLAEVTWAEAARVASLARFLSVVIRRAPGLVTPQLWDLACCSLVSWTASVEESVSSLCSPPAALVAAAVCGLAAILGSLMTAAGAAPALPPKLRQEWEEFFAEGVYSALVPVFISVTRAAAPAHSRAVTRQLAAAVSPCPGAQLLGVRVSPLHLARDVDLAAPLPDSLTFLYNHVAPLLLAPCRHTRVSACQLLTTLARSTPDTETEEQEAEETKEIPRRLLEIIKQGDTLLDTILQEFRVGEAAGPIPAGTEAHTLTVGYLLCWSVVLALLEAAGDETRPRYTEFLKAGGHLDSLLGHLFRLLPRSAAQDPSLFLGRPSLEGAEGEEVSRLAGSCWMAVCRGLPAVARTWWQNTDKLARDAVEKVTAAVVTPVLWREESEAIQASDRSDNMRVRVRDSVREVVATYTIDEGSLELVISLATNHPLGGVAVDTGNRVGVDMAQWRKWMLQLTTFLSYQNGTILGGLNLWKKNVDKRFEGVEVG